MITRRTRVRMQGRTPRISLRPILPWSVEGLLMMSSSSSLAPPFPLLHELTPSTMSLNWLECTRLLGYWKSCKNAELITIFLTIFWWDRRWHCNNHKNLSDPRRQEVGRNSVLNIIGKRSFNSRSFYQPPSEPLTEMTQAMAACSHYTSWVF